MVKRAISGFVGFQGPKWRHVWFNIQFLMCIRFSEQYGLRLGPNASPRLMLGPTRAVFNPFAELASASMEEEAWNLERLEESSQRFWSKFFEETCNLLDFAIAQTNCFPQCFMDQFIHRLSKSRWTANMKQPNLNSHSQYQIPVKIMARLIAAKAYHVDHTCSLFPLNKTLKRFVDKERLKMRRKRDAVEKSRETEGRSSTSIIQTKKVVLRQPKTRKTNKSKKLARKAKGIAKLKKIKADKKNKGK